jgi:hypothetical protein
VRGGMSASQFHCSLRKARRKAVQLLSQPRFRVRSWSDIRICVDGVLFVPDADAKELKW